MKRNRREGNKSKNFLSFISYYWCTDLGVRSLSWKHKGLLMEVLMLCLEHGKREMTGYMLHCDGTLITDVELIEMYGGDEEVIAGLRAIRNAGQLTFDREVGGWYNRVMRHWWLITSGEGILKRKKGVDDHKDKMESVNFELDKWSKLENEMRAVGLEVEGGMLEVMQRMYRRADMEWLVRELVGKVRNEGWRGSAKEWLASRGQAADS